MSDISENIFTVCKDGTDFENWMVKILGNYGFDAKRVGNNDNGVDIVAATTVDDIKYSFNIQCKLHNMTVGKGAVREVYAGTSYYGNGAHPVVITNNRMTAETRVFARRLGVEIIAAAEWKIIYQTTKAKKIIDPNMQSGLLSILLARIVKDNAFLSDTAKGMTTPKPKVIQDNEQLELELINDFDAADEYLKEAARLQQEAADKNRKALKLQKNALLKNLEYG